MSDIPPEVIDEILSRLSVKSLLRFKISLPRVPPKGEGKYMFFDQICGGFGYDSLHDDYKVVRIVQCVFSNGNLLSETMTYSLKMGVWKDGEDCPYWLVKEDFGTYAAGALYWLGFKESHGELILVSLDLGSERFEQVLYPENLGKPYRLNLAALGDCLCLLAASGHVVTGMDVKNHVDVWVMKAYGVEQSWIKLFTVEQLEGRQHFSYMRPIAYSMTGGEVLLEMDNRKFLWYNLEKKSLKHAKIGGGLNSFESFVNFRILVPLYGRGNEKDSKKGA
ncbi:hypothetical protein BC332_31687 [Capsicum chinense]|nr:hypothetical protein BC332_31687 [Capsicum chinense]